MILLSLPNNQLIETGDTSLKEALNVTYRTHVLEYADPNSKFRDVIKSLYEVGGVDRCMMWLNDIVAHLTGGVVEVPCSILPSIIDDAWKTYMDLYEQNTGVGYISAPERFFTKGVLTLDEKNHSVKTFTHKDFKYFLTELNKMKETIQRREIDLHTCMNREWAGFFNNELIFVNMAEGLSVYPPSSAFVMSEFSSYREAGYTAENITDLFKDFDALTRSLTTDLCDLATYVREHIHEVSDYMRYRSLEYLVVLSQTVRLYLSWLGKHALQPILQQCRLETGYDYT